MIRFEKARFLASALQPTEFPHLKNDQGKELPEIALVGKSNVGKSSLINSLLKDKTLAKVSSTPGKTKRINFFLVDEQLVLVDLPGYGYSKVSKEEVSLWSQCIEDYLSNRKTLQLVLVLVDGRRGISKEDLAMMEWSSSRGIPHFTLFTKSDKLSHADLSRVNKTQEEPVLFSTSDPEARRRLIGLLNRNIQWD